MLRPEVSGRISRLGFTDGQRVRRGQLLVQLDDTLQRAQLQQAEAQASIARTNLQRNRELVAQNFVSQSAVDQSAAALRGGRGTGGAGAGPAGAHEDRGAVRRHRRDPQRQRRRLREGRRRPRQHRGRVGHAGRLPVARALSSRAASPGRRGLQHRRVLPGPHLHGPGGSGRFAGGRQRAIAAGAGQPGQRRRLLRPGMFARARIVFEVREGAIVVPEEALVPQGGKQYLVKVVDGADGPGVEEARSAPGAAPERARSRSWMGCVRATAWCRRAGAACCVATITAGPRGGRGRRHAAGAPATRACRRRVRARLRRSSRRRRNGLAGRASAMKISETSIRRPVFATVMSLLLVLVGAGVVLAAAVARIPAHRRAGGQRQHDRLIGASSEVIESQVTKPLEDSIAGIDGVDIITSVSRTEQQPDHGALQARQGPATPPPPRCATACRGCAAGCPTPSTSRSSPRSRPTPRPTIWLAFTSETLRPLELTDLVNRIVKPRLQTVPGVADVQHRRRPHASPCASGSTPTGWPPTG